MNTECEITAVIERIEKMEYYFDTIQKIMCDKPDLFLNNPSAKTMLHELMDYYENGQWLRDYECDERGELPSDLKRGVLSEDGVYNLISEIMTLRKLSDEEL